VASRRNRNVQLVSESAEHIRFISQTEARKLVGTGEALEICRDCGKYGDSLRGRKFCGAHGKQHATVYMITRLYRDHHQSNCSITFSEMLANVGLSKRDEMNHQISQAYENAVKEKVNAWPLCHDTKAPMVVPRI
jgi:hypothetical protein